MKKAKILLSIMGLLLLNGCVSLSSLVSNDTAWDNLLYRYFKFNSKENFYGWDITHYYAAVGTMEEMEMVIEYSYDLEKKDSHGNTPLVVAQRYDNLESFEALLKAGAEIEWVEAFSMEKMSLAHSLLYSYHLDKVEDSLAFVKKRFPDVNIENLVPPDTTYDYFSRSEYFPFEADNTSFSLVNAWWLSECAFLSYADEDFARKTFEKAGFTNFKYISINKHECMVVWDDEKVIISFRGTEQGNESAMTDMITDVLIKQVPYPKGGLVHYGFYTAFNTMWSSEGGLSELMDTLKEENADRKIWITGHSLGGALAAMCFTQMEDATGLYTFGAPKIGNAEFIRLTDGRPKWRVEHNQDPVPRVPITLSLMNRFYYNLGDLIYVGKYGEVIDMTATFYSMSHMNYIQSFIEQDSLRMPDHMPINYAVKLWNNLVEENKELFLNEDPKPPRR